MNKTLTQIGKVVSRALTRELRCESCGKEFSCGASLRGCWCSEINLSSETRAGLKDRYRDCLCRDCLEQLAEPRAESVD